jgi:hypothetical protein
MSIITANRKLKIFEEFQNIERSENNIGTNGVINASFVINNNPHILHPKLKSLFAYLFDFKGLFWSPKKYFENIKFGITTINPNNYDNQKEMIKLLKKRAKENHQTALLEKYEIEETRIEKELKLISFNFYKFISEDHIVKFSRYNERMKYKGVKLDWIKNFTRIIPENVQEKLTFIESTKIFDNYVILHYDPENKGNDKTEKEKDPILFGVMNCSRRLYYIGDWIDEYCDLTLDKIIKHMSLNDKSFDLRKNNII